MSERDLFIQSIPQIAEMVVEIQKMEPEQYEEFKREYLEEVKANAPGAVEFIEKVLIVIDTYLQGETEGSGQNERNRKNLESV